ncbi:Protein of unknown function [Gryllus bimaculatus]|nr:Protein of unknown function [Gryllus bimaculatus]
MLKDACDTGYVIETRFAGRCDRPADGECARARASGVGGNEGGARCYPPDRRGRWRKQGRRERRRRRRRGQRVGQRVSDAEERFWQRRRRRRGTRKRKKEGRGAGKEDCSGGESVAQVVAAAAPPPPPPLSAEGTPPGRAAWRGVARRFVARCGAAWRGSWWRGAAWRFAALCGAARRAAAGGQRTGGAAGRPGARDTPTPLPHGAASSHDCITISQLLSRVEDSRVVNDNG